MEIPYTLAQYPDYVIGVEKNVLVRVPIGCDMTGGGNLSEARGLLFGTQNLTTGAISGLSVTGGVIDGTTVGSTTRAAGAFTTLGANAQATLAATRVTSLQAALTDGSGTPGNVTQAVMHGRAAFAAAASTVTVTNSTVAATSTVLVSLGGSDATLTSVRVTTAAGSFTVTGNAAATGITPFDYVVVQT